MNFIRMYWLNCLHEERSSKLDEQGSASSFQSGQRMLLDNYTSNMHIILPSTLVSFTSQVIQYKLLCDVSSCIYVVSLCCVL
ncbi:hypothetical protein MKW98_028551 [Papaver atlanticum]|uniref:Uncharacterized protein n=1 Tax=Papaver atlanticum TaxID=357466 RepID=A0AAD4XVM5_9MAGN|nr:hypothetical protein MKW98_028551 [Papaver atlanticum]